MTSIYEHQLDENAANYVALSPVSFVERSAEVFGDLPAVVHGARRYRLRERARSASAVGHAMTIAADPQLLVRRDVRGVVTLTLNRPKAFNSLSEAMLATAYDDAGKTMACNMMDDAALEGVQAFIEKRKPNWE